MDFGEYELIEMGNVVLESRIAPTGSVYARGRIPHWCRRCGLEGQARAMLSGMLFSAEGKCHALRLSSPEIQCLQVLRRARSSRNIFEDKFGAVVPLGGTMIYCKKVDGNANAK